MAASWFGLSCRGLQVGRVDHGFEGRDIVTAGEGQECLARVAAGGDVDLENALDELRAILGLHAAVELAGDAGVRPEATADVDMEAFDRVVSGDVEGYAASQHADVAD